MPYRATQDRRVMVESSEKMWSTGEGNEKPFQYTCSENPMKSIKGKKIWYWKMNAPGQKVPSILQEKSGDTTPERMKICTQRKNMTTCGCD